LIDVPLPPGCSGFTMQDGKHYSGREGGTVRVSDEHAPFIRRQVGGDAGLVGYAAFRTYGGTKDGRWCPDCRRLWNRWSACCPRCGQDTIPEAEMPPRPPSRMPSECLVPITPAG
jgi:hypothetical protein